MNDSEKPKEYIPGDATDNTLQGSDESDDTIKGFQGDDTLSGGEGDDTLYGDESGASMVHGDDTFLVREAMTF